MLIIAHRGYWVSEDERNTEIAFRRALSNGYGIETDVRDFCGHIVISHDMPRREHMTLERFLDLYSEYSIKGKLALNIKSDGLSGAVSNILRKYKNINCFVFDMSVPDAMSYLREGIPTYMRRSEFEFESMLDARAQGLWVDALEVPYVNVSAIQASLVAGLPIVIVSPELHNQPHQSAWDEWRQLLSSMPERNNEIMLCTDFPEQAEAFFN